MSADPIGLAGGDNRFGYANGDPVGFVDPEGLSGEEVLGRGFSGPGVVGGTGGFGTGGVWDDPGSSADDVPGGFSGGKPVLWADGGGGEQPAEGGEASGEAGSQAAKGEIDADERDFDDSFNAEIAAATAKRGRNVLLTWRDDDNDGLDDRSPDDVERDVDQESDPQKGSFGDWLAQGLDSIGKATRSLFAGGGGGGRGEGSGGRFAFVAGKGGDPLAKPLELKGPRLNVPATPPHAGLPRLARPPPGGGWVVAVLWAAWELSQLEWGPSGAGDDDGGPPVPSPFFQGPRYTDNAGNSVYWDGRGWKVTSAAEGSGLGVGERVLDVGTVGAEQVIRDASRGEVSGLDDLGRFRRELGLAEGAGTLARLDIGGKSFYGINAHGQPTTMNVNAITRTHAEADVFQQAINAGVSANTATLYVDRALCPSCGTFGGVRGMARQLGLASVTVTTPSGTQVITP